MHIHDLFDDKSDLYASARPQYPSELYEWLAGCCDATQQVWDVGCGSGQAAIDLKKIFESVQATDVSPSQIENAPEIEGITFSVQRAEHTNFDDNCFDAICVAQTPHWFDYELFWPEVKRVLKPNGVFCAWGYSWPHIDQRIDDLLETTFLSVIRPYWAPQNQLLWDGYVDVPLPFEHQVAAPEIELVMNWSLEQFFAYLHSWSATRRCMEENGDDFFMSSYDAITKHWPPEATRKVSMAFFVVAGKDVA